MEGFSEKIRAGGRGPCRGVTQQLIYIALTQPDWASPDIRQPAESARARAISWRPSGGSRVQAISECMRWQPNAAHTRHNATRTGAGG
eukprot:CAMPEP_0174302972 /NCGR_PEP_ID=MMETSP0809-20121228/59917_1 /TAXON_ID=73025 ORGANISM="Eutreptiella gymnastica-like, Strain CCMP1594" /NCGR_SAMPLE_ID=MMETSP0809 /ASSEMBLY_ACC=CAM_ASM_000658 /LENGTH=87 /DNA_ID=CAMNT_0015408925 /DNA_START=1018 /DNA_END=1277 /DNA_ORIENTATION=+